MRLLVATRNRKKLQEIVAANRGKADFLAVVMHWGREYDPVPQEKQQDYGRAAIDAGADIVVGHHPHVVQPVERYKDGLIAYSLGNFAFGSYGNPPRKTADTGLVLAVTLRDGSMSRAVLYPVNVFNHDVKFQPRLFRAAISRN